DPPLAGGTAVAMRAGSPTAARRRFRRSVMRKVALVLASLFLLATAGLGLLAANRGIKDAKAIDEIYGESKEVVAMAAAASADPAAQELKSLAERTGALKAGAVIYGLAA